MFSWLLKLFSIDCSVNSSISNNDKLSYNKKVGYDNKGGSYTYDKFNSTKGGESRFDKNKGSSTYERKGESFDKNKGSSYDRKGSSYDKGGSYERKEYVLREYVDDNKWGGKQFDFAVNEKMKFNNVDKYFNY